MRVVLIGFRGTGKTETGRLLSHLLSVPFLDTDAIIETAAGMTIHEIFSPRRRGRVQGEGARGDPFPAGRGCSGRHRGRGDP